MPAKVLFHALNSGVTDSDKLHRVDLERMRLAAEEQTNLLCDAVGKAFLRPGFKHLARAAFGGSDPVRLIEFDAGADQVFALELGNFYMRIWDGEAVVSRPAVATAVVNGDMGSAVGWTLGALPGTIATISGGQLKLQATSRGPRARAYARQEVTVAPADEGVEHGLNIVVASGYVRLRVGTSPSRDNFVRETVLRAGRHSIAFVPTGSSFWIEFSTRVLHPTFIDSATIDVAGEVNLVTPWAAEDLSLIRYDQSLDVMFVACEGYRQMRIETRGDNSWSVCEYAPEDGPFLFNSKPEANLKPTVLEGRGLLQSDIAFFNPNMVGSLFRIYHDGQKISTMLTGDDCYTPTIMVTGINEPDYNEREWVYTISGVWAGTLRVERSFDGEDVEFHTFRKEQASALQDITANVGPITNDDNEDNAIAYYRIGFQPGTYTSGVAQIDISYDGGGGYGIARVVGYNGSTEVEIDVLRPFVSTEYSNEWRQGSWSDDAGWPTAVAFDDGRLNWAGYGQFWGSVSDAFESFDEDLVGDAGPLLRALAVGGRNEARWMMSLSRLMVGTNRLLAEIMSSSLDEPKTPSNFGVKRTGARAGAAKINPAILANDRSLFVETSGRAIYEINYDASQGGFQATEFSKLTTDVFQSGITGMAVQYRPDQRIWVTTAGGDAVCIVYEPEQQVVAFIPIVTSGADKIESIVVLPSDNGQDRVMAVIERFALDGVTSTREIEMLAIDEDAKASPGFGVARCLDSHVEFGFSDTTVTMPAHLVGRTVWVWTRGQYVEDEDGNPVEFVVPGDGEIDLDVDPVGLSGVGGVAGLPYTGRYKSAKLEYGSGTSTSVLTNKVVSRIGFLFADYVRSGITFGTEFDNADHPLFNLPMTKDGVPVDADVISGPDRPEPAHSTSGPIGLDERMCIEVTKPATILALVMEFEGHG